MSSVLVLSGSRAVYQSLRSILGARASVEHRERLADLHNLLAARPIDVVIVDTELRDCAGADALGIIARENPDATLIALTLSARFDGLPPDEAPGLFAYLTKPFEADQVRFVVERAIERAELHRRVKYLDKQVRAKTQAASPAQTTFLPAEADPGDARRESSLFRRCARVFAREAHAPALATGLAEVLAEEFVVTSVAVLLWDEVARRFALAAATGLNEQAIADAAFQHGRGIAGWLAENGVVLRRQALANTFDTDEAMGLEREFGLLRAEAAVPLLWRGALLGFLTVGRKVTGRAIAEAELESLALVAGMAAAAVANSRTRQALAFEKQATERIVAGLDVGIVAADARGTIVTCNRAAAEALGLERAPTGNGLPALGADLWELADEVLRSGERVAAREVRHETSGRVVRVDAAPIPGDGEPAGVLLVVGEAARRPPAREIAGETERIEFWSQLAARMAHKLKNPLVSIKTFTQLLPERYGDDEFRRSFLDVVDAEADKINEIADRLTLYSAAHELEPVPTDLRALVETVLDSFGKRIRDCGVELERHLVTLPVIMADPERLTLALCDVVENALEAMDGGGRLVVGTRLVEGPISPGGDDRRVLDFTEGAGAPFCAIEIGDSGGGIPRETLSRVFQPFYSDSVRGIGLGLAIVAKVVQEHRGAVEVVSAPGKGTRIQLLLPTAR